MRKNKIVKWFAIFVVMGMLVCMTGCSFGNVGKDFAEALGTQKRQDNNGSKMSKITPKEAEEKLRGWGKAIAECYAEEQDSIMDSEEFCYIDQGYSVDNTAWLVQQAEILSQESAKLTVKALPFEKDKTLIVYDYSTKNACGWNSLAFYTADDQFRLCVDDAITEKIRSIYQCEECGGQGHITTGNAVVCPICGGSGQQYMPDLYGMGQGGYVGCLVCGGAGHSGSGSVKVCNNCKGFGFVHP